MDENAAFQRPNNAPLAGGRLDLRVQLDYDCALDTPPNFRGADTPAHTIEPQEEKAMQTPETILHAKIDEAIEALRTQLHDQAAAWSEIGTPAEMLELEQTLDSQLGDFQTQIVGGVLEARHADLDFVVDGQTQALSQGLRNVEWRPVTVRTLGGGETTLHTPYAARKRKKKGRRRKPGKRGRGGSGDYPVLRRLGIVGRATPALLAEVNRQVADGPSEVEAQERLAARGIVLSTKTIRRYVRDFAGIALWQRQARSANLAHVQPLAARPLAGKRVILAVDGGRLRSRVNKRGRRRAKSRRHGFATDWREPKVLVIYTIDQRGRKERQAELVYDGTLGDADACFALAAAQLKRLGIGWAQSLTVVGDGAPWIWNRVPHLITQLGLTELPLTEIVDWAHALEKVAAAAKVGLQTGRQSWLKRARKRLRKGQIDALIDMLRALDDRHDSEGLIRKAIDYCDTHRHRMQYAHFEAQGLPIGSGAIESGIRRIVNLRLKSAGTFWKVQNAERVLYLRCQIKAGHWLDFIESVLTQWAADFTVSLAQVNASIALFDQPV